jgi:hypothetical protein
MQLLLTVRSERADDCHAQPSSDAYPGRTELAQRWLAARTMKAPITITIRSSVPL